MARVVFSAAACPSPRACRMTGMRSCLARELPACLGAAPFVGRSRAGRQVYNSCVLPAMTYGAETWTLTKLAQNKLAAAQTKMERSMLNITYKDRRTNIWVRERTKLIDIIYTVRKMKWSWAGHINCLKDDNGDQPRGGETTWTNTGAKRYGKGQHKTG